MPPISLAMGGSPLDFSQRKRCRKGKSCRFSCIHLKKVCLVELPKGINIRSVRNSLKSQSGNTTGSDPGSKAKENTRRILNDLGSQNDAKLIDGDVKQSNVRWEAVLEHDANFVGGGAFGQFVTVPADRLLGGGGRKFPGGIGVKSGEIGQDEVEGIRRAGKLGVGPRLIAARVSSRLKEESSYPEGVIAMTKVPGKRLADIPEGIPGGTSGKAVMLAASLLHRAGVSHNDMHDGNIYVDGRGKVRFVDFGMARVTPKHALAEAMRQFGSLGNLDNVQERLVSLGVTPKEFRKMKVSFGDYVSGGGWDKITESQAKGLIDMFYEGVT